MEARRLHDLSGQTGGMGAHAAIVAVGSEMLTPYRTDTNSLWLTGQLNEIGYLVTLKVVAGDDRQELSSVLQWLVERFDLIFTIGGLGPTEDDLTRECAAEVIGLPLEFDQRWFDRMTARFAERRIPMSVNNRRQAMVPKGAEVLPNAIGTAPGLFVTHAGGVIVLLPGPPHELMRMYSESVEPKLRFPHGATKVLRQTLKVAGLPESTVDQLIAPIYIEYRDVTTTILAAPTGIEIHLSTAAADDQTGRARLHELVERIRIPLGMNLFTITGERMEEVVGRLLIARRATLSTAESCTGGLVSKRLTDVPGSSRYMLGGLVTYSNDAKTRFLDVPVGLIERHGAVSGEVAESMAKGVRSRFGSTLGLGVTGIAGPDGGTEQKPVGLVYVGVADDRESLARRLLLPGDRDQVRERAAQIALDSIRRRLLEIPT